MSQLTKNDLDRMTTAAAVHLAQRHAKLESDLVPTAVNMGPAIVPPTPPPEETLPCVYDEVYPFEDSVPYREVITFGRVARFFLDPTDNYAHLRTLVNIKTRRADISLRLIEFFLTKYVSTNDTARDVGYFIPEETKQNGVWFNVGMGYKNGLDMYTKKCFDFFARGKDKFTFGVRGKPALQITTSLRQLNFFKWAIRNKVIDYVRKHRDEIAANMKRLDQAERANKKRAREEHHVDDMDVVSEANPGVTDDVPPAKRQRLVTA